MQFPNVASQDSLASEGSGSLDMFKVLGLMKFTDETKKNCTHPNQQQLVQGNAAERQVSYS